MPIISKGAASLMGFGQFTSVSSNPIIRSSTTAGATGSVVVNKPSGVVSGDLLVICASVANNTTATLASTGFTSVASVQSPISAILVKVAGGSEPSTYTVTSGISSDATVVMFAITTGTYSTGVVDIGTWSTSTSGSTITAPSLSVTNSSSLLIATYGVRAASGGSTTNASTPTGMTSINMVSSGLSFTEEFSQAVNSGATGTRVTTISRSGSTDGHHGQLIAIK